MHRIWAMVLLGLWMGFGNILAAQHLPMEGRPTLLVDRQPMFGSPGAKSPTTNGNGSLFAGQGAGSMLAPYPARQKPLRSKPVATVARFSALPLGTTPLARIRHLIASAEAGSKGYDAVQFAAKRLPPKPPTQLTVLEIYQWIKDTPGQQHAIGRYQFIPATLKRLVKKKGVSLNTRFDARLQDALADILLAEAGVHQMMAGKMPRKTFMHNLAKIWAGLPTASGHSYYKGVAGNKATMTWAHFEREMKRIFPG